MSENTSDDYRRRHTNTHEFWTSSSLSWVHVSNFICNIFSAEIRKLNIFFQIYRKHGFQIKILYFPGMRASYVNRDNSWLIQKFTYENHR